jgi:hypothetical protein
MIAEGLLAVARFGGNVPGPNEGKLLFRTRKEVGVNGLFDPAIHRIGPG